MLMTSLWLDTVRFRFLLVGGFAEVLWSFQVLEMASGVLKSCSVQGLMVPLETVSCLGSQNTKRLRSFLLQGISPKPTLTKSIERTRPCEGSWLSLVTVRTL